MHLVSFLGIRRRPSLLESGFSWHLWKGEQLLGPRVGAERFFDERLGWNLQ
jgi:hypothetical protein